MTVMMMQTGRNAMKMRRKMKSMNTKWKIKTEQTNVTREKKIVTETPAKKEIFLSSREPFYYTEAVEYH